MIYTSLRIDPPEMWGLKGYESIGSMIAKIREQELNRSIDLLVQNGKHPKVLKLKLRRESLKQKPCLSTAGRKKAVERTAA